MKDRLEEFIIENREAFDIYEPDPRIWNRVRDNLPQQPKGARRLPFSPMMRIAAIGLILVSVLAGGAAGFAYRQKQLALQAMTNPELQEAERYYTNLYTEKYSAASAVLTSYPGLVEAFNGEMSLLDSICTSLKADLKDDAANAEVVQALIENYRMRITLLEHLLYELEAAGQSKNNKNDYDI